MSKWNPYALKKPCANCPFLKDEQAAISLAPGRRDGILEELLSGETTGFACHKSVYSKKGGTWVENEETGEEVYEASNNEQQCAGAMIALEKLKRPTNLMTIMGRIGVYKPEQYKEAFDMVIDYEPK